MAMEAGKSLRKVVVETRDGQLLPGFGSEDCWGDTFTLINRQGKERSLTFRDLKAIYFVRDFDSNSLDQEVTFFSKLPVSPRVWVRIEFSDGRQLEGKVENDLNLLQAPGFYFWPSDREGSPELIYIIKSSLKNFNILSTE